MLLNDIAGRHVVIVGGKGGVGKTSVSAALAHARASRGDRVLLVSTDPAHNLGHLWGMTLGDEPTRLLDTGRGLVDGVEIDPERTVERHLAAVHDLMVQMLPERLHAPARRHLELARNSPGSHESAVLERVAEAAALAREDYDLVVFDTAPTGHTLRLLALPEQLTGWAESLLRNRDRSERFSAAMSSLVTGREVAGGDRDAMLRRTLIRRRERFAALRDQLADPSSTAFLLVTIAEAMPVAESLALAEELQLLGMALAAVVVNRRSPADAGDWLARKREAEAEHLAQLHRGLVDASIRELPLLDGSVMGADGVARLAALLA